MTYSILGALAVVAASGLAAGCYGSEPLLDDGTAPDPVGDLGDPDDFAQEPSTVPDFVDEIADVHVDVHEDDDPEAPMGGLVGDPCAGIEECGGVSSPARLCNTDMLGYLLFPGGYCSADCTTSEDCGAGAVCVDLFGLGRFCMKSCTALADCRVAEAYECSSIPGAHEGLVCMPPGSCPGRGYDCSLHPEFDPFDPLGMRLPTPVEDYLEAMRRSLP